MTNPQVCKRDLRKHAAVVKGWVGEALEAFNADARDPSHQVLASVSAILASAV